MKQLYGTGVPFPFDCAFACKVKDSSAVRRALHFALGKSRVNPNREFFEIEPERVIAILKLLQVDDVTVAFEKELDADVTAEEKASAEVAKVKRRPRIDYHELGIPNGSVLHFKGQDGARDGYFKPQGSLQGEECSLASATRKTLGLAEITPSSHRRTGPLTAGCYGTSMTSSRRSRVRKEVVENQLYFYLTGKSFPTPMPVGSLPGVKVVLMWTKPNGLST